MSERERANDGGPAFPNYKASDQQHYPWEGSGMGGLSRREWFAGQALATVIHLTQSRDGSWDPVAVAAGAFAVADAMLAESAFAPPPAPEKACAGYICEECSGDTGPARYCGSSGEHYCRCSRRRDDPVHAAPENAKCRRCGAAHPWCGNPDHVYGCDCGSRNCPGPAPEKVGEGEASHHFECRERHTEAIKETAICIAKDHRCRHCIGYRFAAVHERSAHRDGKEK
jgi:hypothetical protein